MYSVSLIVVDKKARGLSHILIFSLIEGLFRGLRGLVQRRKMPSNSNGVKANGNGVHHDTPEKNSLLVVGDEKYTSYGKSLYIRILQSCILTHLRMVCLLCLFLYLNI